MNIYSKSPQKCSIKELSEFKALVLEGGEVRKRGLLKRIKRAESLFFVEDGKCIGIAAIKKPYDQYKNNVFKKAGVPNFADNYSLELGWIYISPSARGKGIGSKIMKLMINAVKDSGCFATTRENNKKMRYLFEQYSFSKLGKNYASENGDYFLTLYAYNT